MKKAKYSALTTLYNFTGTASTLSYENLKDITNLNNLKQEPIDEKNESNKFLNIHTKRNIKIEEA